MSNATQQQQQNIVNTPQEESSGGTYLCSKCGQLKKGHVCPNVATKPLQPDANNISQIMIAGQIAGSGMATRRSLQMMQPAIQQQQQQQQLYLQQQQLFLQQLQQQQMQQQQGGIALFNPPSILTPTGLTPEQKKAREKAASDFNMWFLLERQERYPYYFDPHTKTIQVIGSWTIDVNDQWSTLDSAEKKQLSMNIQKLASHRHNVLQRQADIQNLQAEFAKQEANKQKEHKKMLIAQAQRDKQLEDLREKVPKPKTNITAFFHYLNDNREAEKRLQPELMLSDISKVLGQKWKSMTEEEKQPYSQRAIDDKLRYEAEMVEYRNKLRELQDTLPPIDLSLIPDPEEPPQQPPQQQGNAQQTPNASQPGAPQQQQQQQGKKCDGCHQSDGKEMLNCVGCLRSYHGKCLQLSPYAVETIKKAGNWKCIECKLCEVCKSDSEDRMIFCDVCDKGYHTYCLKPVLNALPVGGWRCQSCCYCVHCGTRDPKQWHNSTCCESCYQAVGDSKYCTICRKVVKQNDKKPTIQCYQCERWTHTACDHISNDQFEKFRESITNNSFTYKCPTCRTGSYVNSVGRHQKVKPLAEEDAEEEDQEEESDQEVVGSKRRHSTSNRNDKKRKKKNDDDDDVNVDE